MTAERIAAIRMRAESALIGARRSKKDMGSVIWSRVYIYGIICRQNLESPEDIQYIVEIAKAQSTELDAYVTRRLHEHGFHEVIARSEW